MTTNYIDVVYRAPNADKGIDKTSGKMKRLGRESDNVNKSFGALSKVATGVFTGLLVNQIVTYTDKFTSLQNQLRQVTTTTKQLNDRTAELLAISNRSRVGISDTAELYTQLTLSTKSLNLTTEEQLRLTETISKSFAVSGKSAAESAGAIRQLGQAFSAGALRGDEFNSIAEGAPEILRALERHLKLTTGELRAFAATGGITAEVMAKALGGAADVIDQKMSKAVKTFGQSTEIASNNMTVFIGESEAVNTVVTAAGTALVFASENIEMFGELIAFSATVMAARMIPSTTALIAGMYSTATSMGVATVATRGLSAAMGLLGGPLGVITLAVSALVIFGAEAETQKEKTVRLSSEVDKLSLSYQKLNQQQRVIENSKISAEMDKVREKISGYREHLDGLNKNNFNAVRQITVAIKEQEEILDSLSQKQQALVQSGFGQFTDLSQEAPSKQGKGEAASSKETTNIDDVRARLALETDALAAELDNRRALKNKEITQQQFDDEAELQRIRFQFEEKRLAIDENEKLTGLQRAQLKLDIGEQELLAERILQQRLTDEAKDGADERKQLLGNQLNSLQSYTNTAFVLANAFGNKSEKQRKKFAKAQIIINTGIGITRAFSDLGWPGGIPAAALAAATGAAQLAAIGSSGGNPSPSTSSRTPNAAPSTPSQNNTSASKRQVIDINVSDDSVITGKNMKDIFIALSESDGGDLAVAINNGQAEAIRIGAIEG
jgi:tape measure domain-containing protein